MSFAFLFPKPMVWNRNSQNSTAVYKLGKPFEQAVNQFIKTHPGSGLGLAISRSELHGGVLRIFSREREETAIMTFLEGK